MTVHRANFNKFLDAPDLLRTLWLYLPNRNNITRSETLYATVWLSRAELVGIFAHNQQLQRLDGPWSRMSIKVAQ
jgi:hypothetical protein